MDRAMVAAVETPIRGSTPVITENEIASGMRASATTRALRTSMGSCRGDRSASRIELDFGGRLRSTFARDKGWAFPSSWCCWPENVECRCGPY
jgi:hypothetical protein